MGHALALQKMDDRIRQREGVDHGLSLAIAMSMVKSRNVLSGNKVVTAQQLLKFRLPGVTIEEAAEHIAVTLESLGAAAYITNDRSVLRDDVGTPKLTFIGLPRRALRHIFSSGHGKFAIAYRDLFFELADTLVATMEEIQAYNEDKEESHLDRSAAHQEIHNFVRDNGLIVPRLKPDGTPVSSNKQASAKIAAIYYYYYLAAIHPNKRVRAAASDVGVAMTSKPIIGQTTKICMSNFRVFKNKVERRVALKRQMGVAMSIEQAARQVADEDIEDQTYVERDVYGHKYGEDDQVRVMTDDAFAAIGVASSTLPALPAPQ